MSNPEFPRVDVEALPDAPNPTTHKKEVDEALGIEAFGFNVYTARPGERLPWGYHYHLDHEELLYVIEGELELETPETRGTGGDDDGGTADGGGEDEGEPPRLAAGEALLVSPGAPQCTRAVGDSVTRVIAAGAPKDADGAVISEFCPACEEHTDRTYDQSETDDGPVYVLSCADCGKETDRLRAGPE
jgi:quercetin dioxygenase-like cupin family protein